MNTYGFTVCPKCRARNTLYRSIEVCKISPVWDDCRCFECGHEYKHTEQQKQEAKNDSKTNVEML